MRARRGTKAVQPASTRTQLSDTAIDEIRTAGSKPNEYRSFRACRRVTRAFGAERVWNTASAGTAPDTSPGELTALGDHASACERGRGRLSAFVAFDALEALLAARFWTTMLVVALLIGVLAYFA